MFQVCHNHAMLNTPHNNSNPLLIQTQSFRLHIQYINVIYCGYVKYVANCSNTFELGVIN